MKRELDVRIAALIALGMFLVFMANGREIGTYDSQSTKFAARELLLRGTLSLNHVVGTFPQLAERPGFQLARDGRYRSAYSPIPSIAAAAVMWPFWKMGIVDVRAPLAPNLMSAVSGAFFVAVALALAFLTARLELSRARALGLVAALGLGTGLWSTASQTVWQHEIAIFGLTLTVLCWTLIDRRSADGSRAVTLLLSIAAGLGLGLAGGARLQLAPAVVVMLFGIGVHAGWRSGLVAAAGCAAIIVPVCAANLRWFDSVMGASPMLVALHETVHAIDAPTFSLAAGGFTGLLFSPNRGLLVFSPIVAVAVLGVPRLLGARLRSPLIICTMAAWAQYSLYASYAVWWGGHTYGPRYMLDVLPLLLPLGIAGAAAMRGRVQPALAAAAFAWSVAVAAIGAFNHPEGRWNNDPYDVDRFHDRLWEWDDLQIARVWKAGPSPQNFSLFTRAAFRVPERD